jgi:hypothetical protein
VICGKVFLAGKTADRLRQCKTCSVECQRALTARHASQQWEMVKASRMRTCPQCGDVFRAADRPRKKTCSPRCAQHRRREQEWRHRQVQKANGQKAMCDARRRASGYMKRYKRQWRRRRAEEAAGLELLVLTTAALSAPRNAKGESDGNHH